MVAAKMDKPPKPETATGGVPSSFIGVLSSQNTQCVLPSHFFAADADADPKALTANTASRLRIVNFERDINE